MTAWLVVGFVAVLLLTAAFAFQLRTAPSRRRRGMVLRAAVADARIDREVARRSAAVADAGVRAREAIRQAADIYDSRERRPAGR